jgi:hypothetical protein
MKNLDYEKVITIGDYRITVIEKDGEEMYLKIMAEKGIGVFPKSSNTVIVKNMRVTMD